MGHGCLTPSHFAADLKPQELYTVQQAARGFKFLQPQSRGPSGQHATDAKARTAGQHATRGRQAPQAFIPRHWNPAAPASIDHPAPAPCRYHGYPQLFVPLVAQSILGPARLVSARHHPPSQGGSKIQSTSAHATSYPTVSQLATESSGCQKLKVSLAQRQRTPTAQRRALLGKKHSTSFERQRNKLT